MGTYLSTPITEKCKESGQSLENPPVVVWGVVDMQGWRKSMEDSHVAQTEIFIPIAGDDEMIAEEEDDPAVSSSPLTRNCSNGDAKVFGVFDGHGGPEVARFCSLYLVSVLQQQPTWRMHVVASAPQTLKDADSNGSSAAKQTDIGQALVTAFHALDRMIDDESRRDELVRLRAIKPAAGATKIAERIPPIPEPVVPVRPQARPSANKDATISATAGTPVTISSLQKEALESAEQASLVEKQDSENTNPSKGTKIEDKNDNNDEDSNEDADSDGEAVGKEEALEMDQNLDDEDDENGDSGKVMVNCMESDDLSSAAGRVSNMFQRLLNVTGAAGQGVLLLGSNTSTGASDKNFDSQQLASLDLAPPPPFRASLEQNGRMICNLPDHPVHAGATAIVAVITANGLLTVANAGDSRAVLCRANGHASALSHDHKPLQPSELRRITAAGGFVNTFGRVNGNLNLSRSIGDLKYKQVPYVAPADQMITAEPDIIQVQLEPTDEFLILGCDGIWDCLSNEKAVEYVRSRIDNKTPADIGEEMLDDIISVDPRVTQGIGGDNMTIMIIDLLPQKRSYFRGSLVVPNSANRGNNNRNVSTSSENSEPSPILDVD